MAHRRAAREVVVDPPQGTIGACNADENTALYVKGNRLILSSEDTWTTQSRLESRSLAWDINGDVSIVLYLSRPPNVCVCVYAWNAGSCGAHHS